MAKKSQDVDYFSIDPEEAAAETPGPKQTFILQAPPFYFGLYADHHARVCYMTGNERMKNFERWAEDKTSVEFVPLKQVEIKFQDKFTAWINPEWLIPATPESILQAAQTWEVITRSYNPRCTNEDGKIDRVKRGNLIAAALRRKAEAVAAAS